MRLVSTLLLGSLIFFLSGNQLLAQTQIQTITADESREVNTIARRFSERFRETKDVEPIVHELFVSNHVDRTLLSEDSSWLLLKPAFARSLSSKERNETYNLLTNWWYLTSLYIFSKHSSIDKFDVPDDKLLPNGVMEIIRRDKSLKPFMSYEGVDENDWIVDTQAELQSMTDALKRLLPMLRRSIEKQKAGTTRAWKETMSDFGTRFKYYKPWLHSCRDQCHGYPEGTRFFFVNAESFQLNIVKDEGKMRIVTAYYYFD
jgi:hypothetical protein